MFGRRPAVAVIVDIQLDAVAIGILIVEGSLGARISAQDRRDAYSFQTRSTGSYSSYEHSGAAACPTAVR